MKLPGIYVEIKGDYTHLQKEIKAAKALVTEQATGISNALNNALSPQQVKGQIDKLVSAFGTLNRASSTAGGAFAKIGVDLGELRRITGLTEAQFAKLQAQLLRTQTSNAQENALKRLATACNLTEKEIRELGTQFGLTTAQINKVVGPVEKASNSFFTFANIARGTLTYLAISGAQGMVGFAKSVFETGLKIDSLQRSFAALAGGQVGMRNEMEFLRRTADATGQDMYTLADSYLKLMASTQGTRLEGEKTKDLFVAMSEASAVLGLSSEKVALSLNAFAQMASKGTVSAEELKGQLGDSLPGALNIAAAAMGKTTSEIMKMMENGELLASNLLPKMARELHNMYQAAAQTAALESGRAAVNQLSQAWTEFKNNLYDSELAVGVINRITGAIKSLNEGMSELVPSSERFRASDYLRDEIAQMEAKNQALLESDDSLTESQIDNYRKRTREIALYRVELEKSEEIWAKNISPSGEKVEVTSKKAIEEGRKGLITYIQTAEEAARAKHALAMRFVQSDDEIKKADAKLAEDLAAIHHKGASNYNQANVKYLEYQKAFEEKRASMARAAAEVEMVQNEMFYAWNGESLQEYLDNEYNIRKRAIDANIAAKEQELANARETLGKLSPTVDSQGDGRPEKDDSNRFEILKKIEIAEKNLFEARAKGDIAEIEGKQKIAIAMIDHNRALTESAILVAEINGEWEKSKELQIALLGLDIKRAENTADDKEKLELLKRQREELGKMVTSLGAFSKGLVDQANEWRNTSQQMSDLARDTASAMQESFSDLFFDSMQGKLKSLGDYVNAFMTSVQRSIANMMAQQVSGAIVGAIGGFMAPTGSTVSSNFSLDSIFGSAKGNVFNSPSLSAYSNSIVSKPTFFAKGGNVMGESGPEAILPLQRTSGGELGVKALMGGGGANVVINVIESPTKAGQQQQRNENGINIIDVFVAQVKNAVAGDIASGSGAIPNALQSTYGLNRSAGAY